MHSNEVIGRYAIGPSLRQLGIAIAFFAVCTVVLFLRALETGGFEAWGLVALSAAFVVLPFVLALVTKWRGHELLLIDGGLILPGTFRSNPVHLMLSDIHDVVVEDINGQRFLVLHFDGGPYYLGKTNVRTAEDFLAIVNYVSTGELEPSDPTAVPPMPKSPTVQTVVLKVTALLTFCGGPLYVSDILQVQLGDPWGFIVAFSPVAVLVFVALTLLDEEPSGGTQILGIGGLLAAAVINLEGIYVCWQLANGEIREDGGLLLFGSVIGFVATALYCNLARRHLWLNDRGH